MPEHLSLTQLTIELTIEADAQDRDEDLRRESEEVLGREPGDPAFWGGRDRDGSVKRADKSREET